MTNKIIGLIAAAMAALIVLTIVAIGVATKDSAPEIVTEDGQPLSISDLAKCVKYTEATPTKAPISITDASLYDELPEITRYPLVVEGHGDVNIEIFTSGEKADKNKENDSWLIKCAESFNKQNVKLDNGKTVSLSVRAVASGLGADYIISGKYLPDLYTPSNILFSEYAIANGGKLEMYNKRLVGNTAGILVRKGSGYTSVDQVINVVSDGVLNMGCTNPQSSAAGLNMFSYILKSKGEVTSDESLEAFRNFNNNIPFVAYTAQQMMISAANGSLDAMVTEYQAYVNDENMKASYDFIPFGLRHDNPLYIVDKNNKTADELKAIEIINNHLMSSEMQAIATSYGFNANDDYTDAYAITGTEISQVLQIYKREKDSGKDVIAVFVADCSGSMLGAPMDELKESLSNGMLYINENNYVGLVSYNSSITIEVPIAAFDLTQKSYFQGGINKLNATGLTHSYSAIAVAMDMIDKAKVKHPDAKCMIFLLSDGKASGGLAMNQIEPTVRESGIPIYTIAYTSDADIDSLTALSDINEAICIKAGSDDIVYQIKSLFNAQL